MRGVDLYSGSGEADFGRIKSAGYDFAMLKATEGHTLRDPRFPASAAAAKSAGLLTGAYHWFWGRTPEETDREAEFFLSAVRGCGLTFFAALDVEQGELKALGRETLTRLCLRFLGRVAAEGFTPLLYTNPDWARNYLDMEALSGYGLWLAQYGDKMTYSGPGTVRLWQHTSSGRVPGVPGLCDLDLSLGDVSWDTAEKKLSVGESYSALCVARGTDRGAAVRTDHPEIAAIERHQPGYTARSGQTGDLYTLRGVSPGRARIIASIEGDSASFPVEVI